LEPIFVPGLHSFKAFSLQVHRLSKNGTEAAKHEAGVFAP